MAWCEANQVDYALGLARNARLREQIDEEMKTAAERQAAGGEAAREFGEFDYQTLHSWSRERRVVAKASNSRASRIRATW